MSNNRKASYKTPPASLRDPSTSQEYRRTKALEEQKRRRAERFDSSRQLDFFADLTLGPSDDELDEQDGGQNGPDIVREGMAQFATMLPPSLPDPNFPTSAASVDSGESALSNTHTSDMQTNQRKRGKKKKGRMRDTATSGNAQLKSRKPNRWADKCMYAELLEMVDSSEGNSTRDGIPEDIETGWVAVTPIPVGKRCLAVTHQASGIAGIAPNMTLRSRVLGKPLMKPFPSPLPPQTILDCILDENWRDNGILHVLDVLKWKSQDVADCETSFRFWWRDTRLSEITSFPPPPSASESQSQPNFLTAQTGNPLRYQFPYPNTFVPIPYHTNTTLAHLADTLIPLTRSSRLLSVSIPLPASHGPAEMYLDSTTSPLVQLQSMPVDVKSDGMILYVSQATYEPGTSPLSSWIPRQAYSEDQYRTDGVTTDLAESPLDMFERLVKRRLAPNSALSLPEVDMQEVP